MALKQVVFTLLSTFILCACSANENRIQIIQSQNPDWDQTTVQKLANWQIETGMTTEMVQAALGKPESVSSEGGEEAWGYAIWIINFSRQYKRIVYHVYFKDDKVTRTKGDIDMLRHDKLP
jgi:outer membrane protein assembly factor BamE (lipoprotein component of BamABCDE complex)